MCTARSLGKWPWGRIWIFFECGLIIRAAHGYLIVYSVTSKESFNKVEEYRKKVYACQDIEEHESFSIVIIGNKCDLESEREVSTQEGQGIFIQSLINEKTMHGNMAFHFLRVRQRREQI